MFSMEFVEISTEKELFEVPIYIILKKTSVSCNTINVGTLSHDILKFVYETF